MFTNTYYNYGVTNHRMGLAAAHRYMSFTGKVYSPFAEDVNEEVENGLYREHLQASRYYEHPFALGPEPGSAFVPRPHDNALNGTRFNFPRNDHSGRTPIVNEDGSVTLKIAIDMELKAHKTNMRGQAR